MRTRMVIGLVGLSLVGAPPARAQQPPPQVGDLVRVEVVTPGAGRATHRAIGRYVGVRDSRLTVVGERGDSLLVARENARGLQVWAGKRRSTVKGLLWGTVVGAVALGTLGAIEEANCERQSGFHICFGPSFGFGFGMVVGAPAGALIGTLVGANVRRDRWRDAAWPAGQVTLDP